MEFIAENYSKQPSIEEIAKHIHLSEYHFQRIFKEWAGVTPKKFLQYITINELKKNIENVGSLAELSETAGLSSQSRVYDLFVKIESVTPEEYKTKGKGVEIYYGVHNTPFGPCLLANTSRGICALEFTEDDHLAIETLKNKWQNATIIENPEETTPLINAIFDDRAEPLKALLFGTKFQVKVWEALLKIPCGKLTSYSSVAKLIGKPSASRAVGSAIGKNNIALLIPCHRVIQQLGGLGGYKWGEGRKLSIIGHERLNKLKQNKNGV